MFVFCLHRETLFFCELCHALARGYMMDNLPSSRPPSPVVGGEKDKRARQKTSASPSLVKSRPFPASTDPDALSSLKQALEVSILHHIPDGILFLES